MHNMILKIENPVNNISVDNIKVFDFKFTSSDEFPFNLFIDLKCALNLNLLDDLINFLNDDVLSLHNLTVRSYEFDKVNLKERIYKFTEANLIEFLLSNEISDIVELNMKFHYETFSMTQNIKNKFFKQFIWSDKKIDHIKNGF